MTLWSLHTPDFSLTCGRVDHTKSKYYQDNPAVYEELWKLIGVPEGQIIWCFTGKDEIRKAVTSKVLWELEVPEKEIVRFVHNIVWNRILDFECKCALPASWRREFHRKAIETFPDDPSKRDDYRNEQVDAFWRMAAPTGNWWDSLFVPKSGEGVSAIVRHPLLDEWVVQKEIWQT